jgi:sarcosine oxidase, subunit beta
LSWRPVSGTNSLLRPLHIALPILPLVTSRITTEPLNLPSDMPALIVVGDHPSVYLREDGGALLWGAVSERPPREVYLEPDPPSRFDSLPLDAVLEVRDLGRRIADAVPLLGEFESMTVAHGAPCHTPDFHPLVGPISGVDGLFILGGDNYAGVTHGPGLASILADEVLGEAPKLLDGRRSFRPERFGERTDDLVTLARDVRLRAAASDVPERLWAQTMASEEGV